MILNALIGGVIIGVAASAMLFFNGRIMGVSGIVFGALSLTKGDFFWRVFFVLGLLCGGFILKLGGFAAFEDLVYPSWMYIVSGLLVGFGTVMGGGCTSGHGICGVSRFSIRSIVATSIFILAGMIATLIVKKLWGV